MSEKNIHHLLFAVVQEQDIDIATHALEALGLPVSFLCSAGGFLGRRNATLLIGLREGMEDSAIKSLEESCHCDDSKLHHLAPAHTRMHHILCPGRTGTFDPRPGHFIAA